MLLMLQKFNLKKYDKSHSANKESDEGKDHNETEAFATFVMKSAFEWVPL